MSKHREYIKMTKDETRLCKIMGSNGEGDPLYERSYFHMWFNREQRYLSEPKSGVLMALVELEDGSMTVTEGRDIVFLDRQE